MVLAAQLPLWQSFRKPDMLHCKPEHFFILREICRMREAFHTQPEHKAVFLHQLGNLPGEVGPPAPPLSGRSARSAPSPHTRADGDMGELSTGRWATRTAPGTRQLLPDCFSEEWRPGIQQLRLGGCTRGDSGISSWVQHRQDDRCK